jgi:amino acid adenylation domain-containing protein
MGDKCEVEVSGQPASERRQLLSRLMQRQGAANLVAPMSFAQQRLWFLEQLTNAPSMYTMDSPLRLRFAVDPGILQRCLNEIVRRHAVLRSTFGVVNGVPVQITSPSVTVELPFIDLRKKPPDVQDAEAERIAAEDYNTPFDLRTGPLLRARLLRLSDNDHIFLLTMHHIVSDGWSLSVFFQELNALYTAYANGMPSSLPELPIQYADFSRWQRKFLEGEVRERQVGYWKRQLAGIPTLDLAADRLRPPEPSFRGSGVSVRPQANTIARLRALCDECEATLFMVLLAAFKILLCRYSGQEDTIVGSPVAGRNHGDTEGLIGFFVNSLVLRTNLAGDPTFREVVNRVRETAIGAYAHQDLPFEMLVEELHPERDAGRNPLFQVMFQLLLYPDASAPGPDGRPETPLVFTATSKFDLTLTLYDSGQAVSGVLEFARDLFDETRIARMASHYEALLDSIAADPDRRMSELNLLTASERQKILGDWLATRAPFPRSDGILQAFEQNVAGRPEAPAVRACGETLSYSDLNRRANHLAGVLRERGVRSGSLVAICLPRSSEAIAAALATFKIGAAYLPLDPELPDERLRVILEESRAAALVANRHLECACPLVKPNDVGTSADTNAPYCEDAIAYVIYTSGSTGKPKGVEIPHRGLTNLIAWHNRTFGVTPESRGAQFAGPGFDAAVWEIWPYLAAGASVEFVPEGVRFAPARLPEWLCAREITHCFVPTPVLEAVLREPWPPGSSLQFLLTGGDRLHRGVRPGLPFRVFNQYGPTENSVVATSGPVPEENGDCGPPTIGRAISNVELFVMDRYGQPSPLGVPGELWIGGAGLARGYSNAPEETAGRFTAHPIRTGEKVYRSGDLVRYDAEGNLEFLGRQDRQVKIRGFRIELGEVETVLSGMPEVREACVVANVEGTDARLIAYLVAPSVDSAILRDRMRERCRARLPGYMIPSDFVAMDAFPLTPNGKVDRAKLPQPERSLQPAYVAPRTGVEETISAIWREELQLERVSVDDNFFDAGGNSLTLARIHQRLEAKALGPISVVELFRYPTIRGLAAFLNHREDRMSPVERARERGSRRREQYR